MTTETIFEAAERRKAEKSKLHGIKSRIQQFREDRKKRKEMEKQIFEEELELAREKAKAKQDVDLKLRLREKAKRRAAFQVDPLGAVKGKVATGVSNIKHNLGKLEGKFDGDKIKRISRALGEDIGKGREGVRQAFGDIRRTLPETPNRPLQTVFGGDPLPRRGKKGKKGRRKQRSKGGVFGSSVIDVVSGRPMHGRRDKQKKRGGGIMDIL